MGTIPSGSGDDIPSGGASDGLAFSAISLNGDCGSYFDGSVVTCTIDKTEYKVSFSFIVSKYCNKLRFYTLKYIINMIYI